MSNARFFGIAITLGMLVSMSMGQTTTGAITGAVTDPSGAAIPGVKNVTSLANVTVDGGVVLHNIFTSQLQSMMSINKLGNGIVEYLPQSLITNTLAAFQLIPQAVDPTQPYIGPANTPGQFGNQVFLYGPWFQTWDISLAKRTRIHERYSIEFRAQALNLFNHPNFFLTPNGSGNITINNLFGQTRNAYNDINSTNDPGSRVLDFQLRFSF